MTAANIAPTVSSVSKVAILQNEMQVISTSAELLWKQTRPFQCELIPVHEVWTVVRFNGIEARVEGTEETKSPATDVGDRFARRAGDGQFKLFLRHKRAPKKDRSPRRQRA